MQKNKYLTQFIPSAYNFTNYVDKSTYLKTDGEEKKQKHETTQN